MNELIKLTAREAVARLKAGDVSPLELIDAALERIEETDQLINALPTLCAERAREKAKGVMARAKGDEPPGYLYGLPIAIKDLTDVAGVRTTYASPIFADHVPTRSDYAVEILEQNGAVVLAKSNTPEFGAGANTFNEVFGETLNPWDTRTTCGGSSGGAAAALAAGQVWLAHGSDLGGSLRIPGAFCSVLGLRPSSGRVARGPTLLPFTFMSVHGPMARNTGDLALFLDAQTGEHPGDPISLPKPAVPFITAADEPVAPKRVAYSPDLGIAPVDPDVRAVCDEAARAFADLGAEVEEACPDLHDAEDIFQVIRSTYFAATRAPLLEKHPDKFKPDLAANIELGLQQTSADIAAAERAHAALYHRTVAFFEDYDLLLCPTVVTPPFPVETRYLTELGGVQFRNYASWLIMTYAITLTHCPALSIPAGFTPSGLPVGLQLVGPPHGDADVISASALFAATRGYEELVPIEPRPQAAPVEAGAA